MGVNPPTLLSDAHDCSAFTSGEPTLDDWLRDRAREGHQRGSARTYVAADEQGRVVGYYALSAGSVLRRNVPGNVRRNMPDAIPVIVLGRLAVHQQQQGTGLGSALLKDAMLRALGASREIGVAALMVHALNDDLRAFYQRFGFVEFPTDSLTFFLPMRTIATALSP